ncbi:hypothetical protein [Roseobacter sp.]|uniref:hypothetical protein n=1 Tax=Roseobacter sp. TaxID=1907202 RepID=UPI0032986355
MADGIWWVNSIVLFGVGWHCARMKLLRSYGICGAALAGLMACAPLSIYHREGAEVARMNADLLTCQVDALAQVPVNTQIRQDPPIYVPARRHCNADGVCHTRGGFFEPGIRYSVDVNADLRDQVTQSCMTAQGYAPVTLPNCPGGVARAAPKANTAVLPRLSDRSCAIKYRDGGWQIVDQAG